MPNMFGGDQHDPEYDPVGAEERSSLDECPKYNVGDRVTFTPPSGAYSVSGSVTYVGPEGVRVLLDGLTFDQLFTPSMFDGLRLEGRPSAARTRFQVILEDM